MVFSCWVSFVNRSNSIFRIIFEGHAYITPATMDTVQQEGSCSIHQQREKKKGDGRKAGKRNEVM